MVYYVYDSECYMENNDEFIESLRVCENDFGTPIQSFEKRPDKKNRANCKTKTKDIKVAVNFKDLPICDRRLGKEAIKNILDRGKTHKKLLERARASVDTAEPATSHVQKWHEHLRARDPMPGLNLGKDVKLHSSWTQLAEIRWQKDWHEKLILTTKS